MDCSLRRESGPTSLRILMQWRDGIQLGAIVLLAALGATLIAVGALASGVVLCCVGVVWFWRLYRASE